MKADPKAETAPKGSKKKLLIIMIVAMLAVVIGAGATWYFAQDKPAGAAHKVVKAEPPEYVPIEQFVVNLQPEAGEQFLQTTFTLQVANPKDGEALKANMAKVRSRVLLLLSGKKASEVSSVDGKRQLATEIAAAINLPFVDKAEPQRVSDVLFTAFIIQ